MSIGKNNSFIVALELKQETKLLEQSRATEQTKHNQKIWDRQENQSNIQDYKSRQDTLQIIPKTLD